jgi:hypothetical protein
MRQPSVASLRDLLLVLGIIALAAMAGVGMNLVWPHVMPRLVPNAARAADAVVLACFCVAVIALVIAQQRWRAVERRTVALAAAEARALTLFEASPIAMWVLDDETLRFVEVNGAALLQYGYGREAFLQLTVRAIRLPDERPSPDVRRDESREKSALRGRHRRKDGSIIQVEIHTHAITYRDRPCQLSIVEDVTARLQADEALRQSEAQFRVMAESSPAGVLLTDRTGLLRYVNNATLRMTGLSFTRALGDGALAAIHPDDRNHIARQWRKAVRQGRPINISGRFLHTDGRITSWRAHSSPIRTDDRTTGHVIVVVDETEQRAAETALRDSEARFRQLAENLPGVVYLIDPRQGHMLYTSPTYETMWGRPRETLYADPRSFLETVHPADHARVAQAYARRRDRLEIEYRIVRPDGTMVWVRDLQFPILRPDGSVHTIAGLAFDITERRQLEDQLAQSQKMESLGRLAGGVAHDFNNLLQVILAYADFLKEEIGEDSPLRQSLGEIEAAGQRASSLTRQLLTFARRQVFEPTVVDVNALALGMERMLVHLIGEDVRVELVLAATSASIRADPHQIEQVVINLAVNARDAMPRGGRLRIETHDVTMAPPLTPGSSGDVPPGDYVVLSVRDTGAGIPPELQAKVFEPFFTTKPKGEGTGLGLSTSYGIVAQFGGHIRLVSEVGRGTTISCFMPRVAPAPRETPMLAPAGSAAGTPATGQETLLLVEDEPMVRDVARRTLERRGYRVITASNGVEGLRAAAAEADVIQLLVTDVVMPQMGGRELADQLTRARPGIRVLFTSGYSEEFALGGGRLGEGIEFLQKPYLPGVLAQRVREVLDGR